MKSCQVGVKAILRFKIDIESHKIQERKTEVFSRWIVHVSYETIRVFRFHRPVQAFEIGFNSLASQPPNNGCRNLIADSIAKRDARRRYLLYCGLTFRYRGRLFDR